MSVKQYGAVPSKLDMCAITPSEEPELSQQIHKRPQHAHESHEPVRLSTCTLPILDSRTRKPVLAANTQRRQVDIFFFFWGGMGQPNAEPHECHSLIFAADIESSKF